MVKNVLLLLLLYCPGLFSIPYIMKELKDENYRFFSDISKKEVFVNKIIIISKMYTSIFFFRKGMI